MEFRHDFPNPLGVLLHIGFHEVIQLKRYITITYLGKWGFFIQISTRLFVEFGSEKTQFLEVQSLVSSLTVGKCYVLTFTIRSAIKIRGFKRKVIVVIVSTLIRSIVEKVWNVKKCLWSSEFSIVTIRHHRIRWHCIVTKRSMSHLIVSH